MVLSPSAVKQTHSALHSFCHRQDYSKFYQTQLAQLKDIVLSNTKMTNDFYESIKRDDYWLSAYEAKEKGIIDEILGVKSITWDK